MQHFGALPHLTIARNDKTENIDYLTSLPVEEYDKVWSQFKSGFWEFKKDVFMVERKEFCYAGDWSLHINLDSGEAGQCYKTRFTQNVFKNIARPIIFRAIGRCLEAHCYNGHALLTLGCIPNFSFVKYGDIRNRIKSDGGEWLRPELKSFFNSNLADSNMEYTDKRKSIINTVNFFENIPRACKKQIKRMIRP